MSAVIAMSNLVIVESPAKANTIKSYLGSGYKVIASKGHIRDLPKSSLGIDVENGFEPHYINIRGKGDVIKELKKEAKNAGKIFLATDPDREGEAISWHIAGQLGIPADKACRVTFNEVTKQAVKDAIRHPRVINEDLVNSQEARRILDRLIGFSLSPILWKNIKNGLSGGRVQSAAVRIITEREAEIRAFVPQEYWTVDATLVTEDGEELAVKLFGNKGGRIRIGDEKTASEIEAEVRAGSFKAVSVRHAEKLKQPAPPFTTATLQQEASRKLGFQTQKIMKVAQELYDGLNLGAEFGGTQGLITYMRTDSQRISQSAQEAAADFIRENYGENCLPTMQRAYKTEQGAQDAHEAIRPSNVLIQPKLVRKILTSDQYRLYKLIWERFIASQMAAAVLDTVSVDFENAGYVFKAGGYMIKFRGYMAVYDNTEEDLLQDAEINFSHLPQIREGQTLVCKDLKSEQHFTEPPARYTEASLVKFFKENGIGRPSTYAQIIQIIISRGYVKRDGKVLVATPLGEITTGFMHEHFPEIIDYEFTADMENKLDSIEHKENTIYGILSGFWGKFSAEIEKASASDAKVEVRLPAEESDISCEKCGAMMVYKNGRFGKFLACPNYPTCRNTKALDKNGAIVEKEEVKPELAGFKCELCGGEMVVRNGRFGTFFACVNYPSCTFTKQKVTELAAPCPRCGSKLFARHGKSKTLFYSCERYPDCDFSSWDMPLDEKCPDCGEMLFYRKSRRSVICKNKKCGYKSEEERTVIE